MQRHRFGFGALIGTTRWDDRPNAIDARPHLEFVAHRFNLYKEWWTEITGKSAADGTFKARGFHGDYLITTRVGNQTRTVRTLVDGDIAALDFNF